MKRLLAILAASCLALSTSCENTTKYKFTISEMDRYVSNVLPIPKETKIPKSLYQKATKDISYILEQGYAERIDKSDFFHFHIILPEAACRQYSSENDEILSDNRIRLLYHTREMDHRKDISRSLVSFLTTEPIAMSDSKEGHALHPEGILCVNLIQVNFVLDSKGEYKLKDGRRIRFKPNF